MAAIRIEMLEIEILEIESRRMKIIKYANMREEEGIFSFSSKLEE